jgi:3-methylcrotonyl-CoA carboxylase alpha subunit
LPNKGGDDPWQALTGWRAWGPAQQSALIEREGERLEAKVTIRDVNSFSVRIGEDTTRLQYRGEIIEIDGIGMRADVMPHPGGVTIFVDEADHRFGFPDPVVPANEAAGGDTVIAPMPGAVKRVTAATGAAVSKGDALVILEAMKMEHTLTAPRDGVIADVSVTEGDQVEDGAVLVMLEAE